MGATRMTDAAVEYYRRKYGDDVQAAFVHTVKEIGDLARVIERGQEDRVAHEITEITGLMHYLAARYDVALDESIVELYSRKLQKL